MPTEPVVTMGEANIEIPAAGGDASTTPEAVEVKIGDKTLKVSKETAEVIAAVQAASATATAQQTSQIQALQQELATVKGKSAPKTPDGSGEENYDELFVNPKKFLDEFAKKIKDELVTAYTQNDSQKEFWNLFYDKHKELKVHDFYVKSVMTRDYGKLKDLTVEQVIETLGTTVKGDLLKLGGGNKPPKGGKPAAEGGTQLGLGESKQGEGEDSLTDKPQTLSGILRSRREARRKAASLHTTE